LVCFLAGELVDFGASDRFKEDEGSDGEGISSFWSLGGIGLQRSDAMEASLLDKAGAVLGVAVILENLEVGTKV